MGIKAKNWINIIVLAIFVMSVIPAAAHATHMTPVDTMPSDQMADMNKNSLHKQNDTHHSQDHKHDADSITDCCQLTSCNTYQFSIYTDFSNHSYNLKPNFIKLDEEIKPSHSNRVERPPTA